MSVQGGIWNFNGEPVDRKLLAEFVQSLTSHGPDGEFCYLDGSTAMLYRPFHTTAESRREVQPHRSERGFLITWDGRLDNRDDLIAELDYQLAPSASDVAIVAAAFDRWETDCFCRFIGDWAISVWRPCQAELLFAVDYMSIRHIFYYLTANRIWWSTSLPTLILLSDRKLHVDEEYIAGYLASDPEACRTPYCEIRQTPPGHFVRVRDGRASTQRYWRFQPKSCVHYKTDREYEEHFNHVFRQSVRRRLRSDSPILAELSGGLDSSSIVCMADDILKSEEPGQTNRLDTISFYDKTEPRGDDWIYFKKIEQKRQRVGKHIDASNLDTSGSLKHPEFTGMPGALGVGGRIEAERAAVVRTGGYRVVLSGFGGDEFTGAIPDPRAHLADLILQFKFFPLTKQLIAWSLAKRQPWLHVLCRSLGVLFPPSVGQYFLQNARLEPWIKRGFAKRTGIALRQLEVRKGLGLRLPSRAAHTRSMVCMASKMSKRVSPHLALEEARYPYLDQDFVEFTCSIPSDQLLRPGERRSLMRRSLLGVVPEEILSRRTKQYAARTEIKMLEKNWETLQRLFESPLSSTLGFIDPLSFVGTLADAVHGKRVPMLRLIKVISLELWLKDLHSRGLLHDTPKRFKQLATVSRYASAQGSIGRWIDWSIIEKNRR
jgi:asparagine synthase (glutamine-hydrolysing)